MTKPSKQSNDSSNSNAENTRKHMYPGEEDSFLWDVDKVQVSIFFTDHQETSIQAYINGIHVSV